MRLEHTSRRGVASAGIVNVVIDSFAYRVLAREGRRDDHGERPPDFAQCPLSGRQTNTMHLGPQPFDPGTSSDGHLIEDPGGQSRSGLIRGIGTMSLSSSMTGCNLSGN